MYFLAQSLLPSRILPPSNSFSLSSRNRRPRRDAAALACVCANAAAAYREGRWPRTVRTKRSGTVLEPASGAFDVTVTPGEGVQAAVDRCPAGGSVMLLPGTHEGPLVLGPRAVSGLAGQDGNAVMTAEKEVHVFGRGRATLQTEAWHVLKSTAEKATVDGLIIRQALVIFGAVGCHGVRIRGGALRLQACNVTSASDVCLSIKGGPGTDPVVTGCTCVGPLVLSLLRKGPFDFSIVEAYRPRCECVPLVCG